MRKAKNILMLSRFFYPHIGGVEKQVEELSKRLIKKGHKVTIITTMYDLKLKSHEIKNKIEIIRFKYPKIKYFGILFIWFWFIKNINLIKKADIIHAHSVLIWYWPLRLLLLRKPTYVTFHGWEGAYPIPKKNILIRKIDALLAWKNITICDYVEKHYKINADKIMYTSVNIPRKRNFKKEKKSLVYVGRLDEDTGLNKILKTLSYLKGFKVDFCGDGPLASECKKYGEVHGFIDPISFFEKAFICLSSGHTSILEAFTYKCLIATTYNNPVKKDYLLETPFSKWMIVRNSPKKLSEEIQYNSKHIAKSKKKIENAYKWVLSQNWENATQEYMDLWGVK